MEQREVVRPETKSEEQTRSAQEHGDPGAVERNARAHAEALRRAVARNQDAELSWASGEHFAGPGGPGDAPFSGEIGNVAGVHASQFGSVSPEPDLAHSEAAAAAGALTGAPYVDLGDGAYGLDGILAAHERIFGK